MKIVVRLGLVAALSLGALVSLPVTAGAACELTEFDVKIVKHIWHNRCSKKNCAELKGAAMVTSRCDEPVAVQVRLTALDESGAEVEKMERWPWDLRSVSAGEQGFSINHWIKYDENVRDFKIQVIGVKAAGQ